MPPVLIQQVTELLDIPLEQHGAHPDGDVAQAVERVDRVGVAGTIVPPHIPMDAAGEARLPGVAEDQAALKLGDRLRRDLKPLDANRFAKGKEVEAPKGARVLILLAAQNPQDPLQVVGEFGERSAVLITLDFGLDQREPDHVEGGGGSEAGASRKVGAIGDLNPLAGARLHHIFPRGAAHAPLHRILGVEHIHAAVNVLVDCRIDDRASCAGRENADIGPTTGEVDAHGGFALYNHEGTSRETQDSAGGSRSRGRGAGSGTWFPNGIVPSWRQSVNPPVLRVHALHSRAGSFRAQPAAATSRRASSAAATVAAMSLEVCASERNAASNCDGAR